LNHIALGGRNIARAGALTGRMEKPAMQAHRKSEQSGNQAVFRVAREKPRPRRISPQAGRQPRRTYVDPAEDAMSRNPRISPPLHFTRD
jgi:hypothetical protein